MITHVLPSASGETRRTSVKRLKRPTGASAHGLLQLLEVELAELRHLGRHHRAAVGLVRVAAEIAAVVLLGGVELRERGDLGHDGVVPDLPHLELLDHLLGDGALLGAVVEDRRAVLRARVGPLAVERGGVVRSEEHTSELQSPCNLVCRLLLEKKKKTVSLVSVATDW